MVDRAAHRSIRASRDRVTPRTCATGPSEWDEEYRAGRWSYLHDATESRRYAALARLLQRLSRGDRILDAGCGEGLLLRHVLGHGGRAWRYTGLDHSGEALAHLREAHPDSRTICSPLTRLCEPAPQEFDALVLSEVLYYLDDAAAPVAGGASWLAPKGILIVSMYRPHRAHPWAERVAASWRAIESVGLHEWAREDVHDARARRCWDVRAYGAAPL